MHYGRPRGFVHRGAMFQNVSQWRRIVMQSRPARRIRNLLRSIESDQVIAGDGKRKNVYALIGGMPSNDFGGHVERCSVKKFCDFWQILGGSIASVPVRETAVKTSLSHTGESPTTHSVENYSKKYPIHLTVIFLSNCNESISVQQ